MGASCFSQCLPRCLPMPFLYRDVRIYVLPDASDRGQISRLGTNVVGRLKPGCHFVHIFWAPEVRVSGSHPHQVRAPMLQNAMHERATAGHSVPTSAGFVVLGGTIKSDF